MTSRLDLVRERLVAAFAPERLELADESARHAGHPGAAGGGSHLRVRMVARAFSRRTLLERHRAVYAALAGMIGREIHALALELKAPEEVDEP